jgi:RNA-directed DNA polymerase
VGIPALEDKLVQLACAKLLMAIYEQDFLDCSYGYRPKRGALDAVRDLTFDLQYGRYGYLVEVDVKGFFDHIDHTWLLDMLRLRIDDRAFLRLIRKWLKVGVLETDGQVIHPETGTPQGGVVTPPTKLQTFFFGVGLSRVGIDPKHNIDLILGDLHPLHQGPDEVPFVRPIGPR